MISFCTRRKIASLYPGRFPVLDVQAISALRLGRLITVWPHKAGGPVKAKLIHTEGEPLEVRLQGKETKVYFDCILRASP